MELPLELWKEIIDILSDPLQYWDEETYDYSITLNNFIPLELSILSSISKKINKIIQDRLKIVTIYVGEHRNIPLLKKPSSINMFDYFATMGFLSLIKEARSMGYQWKESICNQAAFFGHLDVLKYLHESGCKFTTQHLACTAYSSTESLKYLHRIGFQWDHEACAYAATAGSLERLKYLHENGCDWDEETCTNAATSSLECLIYAHEHGCKWNGDATVAAARNGSLEILQYLHEHGCPWGDGTCKAAAGAKNNSLACLTYAHTHGANWNSDVCKAAATAGSLACLKYAHENGCDWTNETSEDAANAGSLECLKYAIENGLPLLSELYDGAAKADSVECMKYLHDMNCPVGTGLCRKAIPHLDCLKYAFEVLAACIDKGIELEDAALELSEECLQYLIDKGLTWPSCYEKWGYSMPTFVQMLIESDQVREAKLALKYNCEVDEGVCAGAAKRGDVYLLKYLHENGYPWDASTCFAAIFGNSVECLQYAHENGCPWNSNCCSDAARHQSVTILKYLHENGCPMDAKTTYQAAESKSFACLKYAHENGCPWHDLTLARAAVITSSSSHKEQQMNESVKILQYAAERGCPLHPDIAHYAAMTGNLAALKWAYENGANWPGSICIEATRNEHNDCLEFIHSRGTCPRAKCFINGPNVPLDDEAEDDDEFDLFF